MNILLFNDTDGNYHFGCTATSKAIKWYLGIPDSAYTHKVADSWTATPVPFSAEDFDDDAFFKNWKEKNQFLAEQIKTSDLCAFTGEGTLHGYEQRTAARNLLYLMYICKKRFQKKVFALNQSCFPVYHIQEVDKNNLACAVYKKVLSVIDFCAVREPISLAILNRLDVKAKIAFDCLLYVHYLHKETKLPKDLNRDYTLISGGSVLYQSYKAFLKNLHKSYNPIGKIYFLASDMPDVNWDDQQCISAIKKFNKKLKTKLLHRRIKIIHAKSVDEWLTVIRNANMIVSGRFHHSVAAAVFGVKYVCLEANTLKIEALNLISDRSNLYRLSIENFNHLPPPTIRLQ